MYLLIVFAFILFKFSTTLNYFSNFFSSIFSIQFAISYYCRYLDILLNNFIILQMMYAK